MSLLFGLVASKDTPDLPLFRVRIYRKKFTLTSDEFYLTGTARRIDDPEIYAQIFADAEHVASPDEILFELEVERAMHTRWEGFGTPEYHPVHVTWAA